MRWTPVGRRRARRRWCGVRALVRRTAWCLAPLTASSCGGPAGGRALGECWLRGVAVAGWCQRRVDPVIVRGGQMIVSLRPYSAVQPRSGSRSPLAKGKRPRAEQRGLPVETPV
eukprot:scaffold12239_cov48-Phaeocystis_antarctica.AAC.1